MNNNGLIDRLIRLKDELKYQGFGYEFYEPINEVCNVLEDCCICDHKSCIYYNEGGVCRCEECEWKKVHSPK